MNLLEPQKNLAQELRAHNFKFGFRGNDLKEREQERQKHEEKIMELFASQKNQLSPSKVQAKLKAKGNIILGMHNEMKLALDEKRRSRQPNANKGIGGFQNRTSDHAGISALIDRPVNKNKLVNVHLSYADPSAPNDHFESHNDRTYAAYSTLMGDYKAPGKYDMTQKYTTAQFNMSGNNQSSISELANSGQVS